MICVPCPYWDRAMYLRATGLRFFKICHSAEARRYDASESVPG